MEAETVITDNTIAMPAPGERIAPPQSQPQAGQWGPQPVPPQWQHPHSQPPQGWGPPAYPPGWGPQPAPGWGPPPTAYPQGWGPPMAAPQPPQPVYPQPPQSAPAVMPDTVSDQDPSTAEFRLSAKIITHKGDLDTLKFKAPTAALYIKHDMPYRIVQETTEEGAKRHEIVFNTARMFKFVSDLCGLDPITLEQIPACDIMPLFYFMVAYLGNPPIGRSDAG